MRAEYLSVGDLDDLELTLVRPVPNWLRKFSDTARARPKDEDQPRREVFLRAPRSGHPDRVVVHSADGTERAEATATDVNALRRVLGLGRQAVTWAAQVKDTRLVVHVHVFGKGGIPAEGLCIGVDDEVADRVREHMRDPRTSFEGVRDWLMEQLSMSAVPDNPHERVRIVHSSTPAADGGLMPDAFTLLGDLWAADVALRDDRLRITRLVGVGNRRGQRWPVLTQTALSFVNASVQEATSEEIRAALAGLIQEGKSYLQLWRAYDELEWQVLVREALLLGVPKYDKWREHEDGTWTFYLDRRDHSSDPREFLRRLQLRDGRTELEATEHIPAELTGEGRGGQGRGTRGTVVRVNEAGGTVDIKPPRARGRAGAPEPPPPHGVLFLALSGSRVSQDRRVRARDRIMSGKAEMRGLAQLIEGVGIPPAQPRSFARYDRVLKRVIRESIPAGSPTESQRKALKQALQTPDLLVVQGPPGTGKTQFITMLLRCLDATGESARAFNRTLITSYQHNAVDNMVRKARNRGLPPTRVDNDEDRAMQSAHQLRAEILEQVKQHADLRPGVARQQRLGELQTLVAGYDVSPTAIGDLADTLDRAVALAGDALSPALAGRLAAIQSRITARAAAGRSLLATRHEAAVRAARSLRTVAGSFADDGPDRAARALPVLDEAGLLSDEDRDLLRRAAAWSQPEDPPPADPPFLAGLAALRAWLLTRLGSDSKAVTPAPARDPDVQVLLHDIADAAERHFGTERGSLDDVLADYLNDLKNGNIALIHETLSRYNAVLAATVQQTDSPAMYQAMDAPHPVFGTVIVDEAARANPLDLMIPMSCARDRIILVGDHKQLPHAMERRIEQELRQTGKYADTSRLQQSLFQRWFDMFSSGSGSIRAITLDEQFRMHPVLGRFVSTVFYGSPTAVKPHLSTHTLTHQLKPYRGKVAGWIDVPHDGHREDRSEHSAVRRKEAKRVADELKSLAAADDRRQLTFGIISFYAGQVKAIQEELLEAGLLVPDDEKPDELRPRPSMEWTDEPKPRPRLRVGTVDAFQGMEFDVVLLSVTRSNPPTRDRGTPETALRRYGHLTSEQRMCVAMSRQRRLLLAVGDAAMADRETAPSDPASPGRSLVEGLVAFLELCKGPYGVVVRP